MTVSPADGPARSGMDVFRSPRWIALHVAALTLVILFINLGLWQLRRLDEVRTRNALLEQRLSEPAISLEEARQRPAADLAYRRLEVTGRYLSDATVLTAPRSREGTPGHSVLTPLAAGDGAVLVNRGWVPLVSGDEPPPEAAPVDGDVSVSGVLLPSEIPYRLGPSVPAEGRLRMIARIDVGRLQQQTAVELLPVYLLAEQEHPRSGQLPLPVAPPERSEGNHLSYAFQWFLFAAVGVIGYPVLLRRMARPEPATPAPARR